jgi:hypothetical protein
MLKQKLAVVLSGVALALVAGAASAHGGYDPYWAKAPERTSYQPVMVAASDMAKSDTRFDWVDRYAPQ